MECRSIYQSVFGSILLLFTWAVPAMAAKSEARAWKTLNNIVAEASLHQDPKVVQEFILPVRKQVVVELAKIYDARRDIGIQVAPDEVAAAIQTSERQEKFLIDFFERHVKTVRHKYQATAEISAEKAPEVLNRLVNELNQHLTMVQSLSRRVLKLKQGETSSSVFTQEQTQLLNELALCEELTQKIAFQLDKVTGTRALAGRYQFSRAIHVIGSVLLIPAVLAELVSRLAIFPGIPAYFVHQGEYGTAAIAAVVMVVINKIASEVADLFRFDNSSYFLPNFTIDMMRSHFENSPQLETVNERVNTRSLEEQLWEKLDIEIQNGEEELGSLSFLALVQSFLARETIRIRAGCEGALTEGDIKVAAYLDITKVN